LLTAADEAVEHLERCVQVAERLGSRSILEKATMLLGLIKVDDAAVQRWEETSRMRDEEARMRAAKVAEIVTLVGVRVVEGWA
jgi:hypothetical protein